jgi:hypothetical protein
MGTISDSARSFPDCNQDIAFAVPSVVIHCARNEMCVRRAKPVLASAIASG